MKGVSANNRKARLRKASKSQWLDTNVKKPGHSALPNDMESVGDSMLNGFCLTWGLAVDMTTGAAAAPEKTSS